MRSTSAGVLRFGLEGYIHVSAIRQCDRSTINASELVLNPNFPKQMLRSSYRNLNFFWLVGKAGLHKFVHDCGNCLPGSIPLPYELGVLLKSPLLFARDDLTQFAQQRRECVVVFFFLNTNAQAVHPLAFFWGHMFINKEDGNAVKPGLLVFSKFFSVLDSFRKNFGLPGSFLGWQQLLRSNENLVGNIASSMFRKFMHGWETPKKPWHC
jgi:hypothetical protein